MKLQGDWLGSLSTSFIMLDIRINDHKGKVSNADISTQYLWISRRNHCEKKFLCASALKMKSITAQKKRKLVQASRKTKPTRSYRASHHSRNHTLVDSEPNYHTKDEHCDAIDDAHCGVLRHHNAKHWHLRLSLRYWPSLVVTGRVPQR